MLSILLLVLIFLEMWASCNVDLRPQPFVMLAKHPCLQFCCEVIKLSYALLTSLCTSQQSQCRLYVDWPSCRPGFEELSVVHHLNWQSSELKRLPRLQKVCRLQACLSDTTRNSLLIVLQNSSAGHWRQRLDIWEEVCDEGDTLATYLNHGKQIEHLNV